MIAAHPEGFDLDDERLTLGEDCIMVRYRDERGFDTFVDVVPEHQRATLPYVLMSPCEKQVFIRESVVRAIDRHTRIATESPHLVTPAMRQDLCDDVAIWWLYEFLAGRGASHVVLDLAEREHVRGLRPAIDRRFRQ
jgi:hypothetical protein